MGDGDLVRWRSGHLLRTHLRGSLALAVVAGLAAAMVMGAASSARRSAGAVPDFLAHARAADLFVDMCPPGIDLAAEGNVQACLAHDPGRELAVIRSMPEVASASRMSWTWLRGGRTPDPATWRPLTMLQVLDPAQTATADGDPVVVAGRLAAPGAPDEVMITETGASFLDDAGPGDRIWLQGVDLMAIDGGQEPAVDDRFPVIGATVAGVVRFPTGLLPVGAEDEFGATAMLHTRAGWVEAHGESVPGLATSVAVWLAGGDVESFVASLQDQLADQVFHTETSVDEARMATLEQATRYESRAGLAVAGMGALVAFLLVGQAVSRQARSEASDWATLTALGATRRSLRIAATLRWAPVAAVAGALAGAGALALSTLGPIGVARRGPWDRGIDADRLVLVAGTAITLGLVVVAAATAGPRRRRRPVGARSRRGRSMGPPPVAAGLGLARRALGPGSALPMGSAVVGVAAAVALAIAATGGAASLHRVADTPERWGVTWDAFVGTGSDAEASEAVGAALSEVPGVAAAATLHGTAAGVAGRSIWVQALGPIDGIEAVEPVITSGREPVSADEIALGSVSMQQAGIAVGDEVEVSTSVSGAVARTYRVVGTTMVTDGYEPNVGIGGLVSIEGLEAIAPEARLADTAVVRVHDDDRDAALASVRAAFPDTYLEVDLPASIRNARRIAGLPVLLALGTALVAALALTHALVAALRRQRHDLTVCRVLGFTRAQAHGAVATEATLLGLVACVPGVVVGIAGARWGWRLVAEGLGVAASGPVLSAWLVIGSVVLVLLIANLVAAPPARRAVSLSPGMAVRRD